MKQIVTFAGNSKIMKCFLFSSVIFFCLGCSSKASKLEGRWKLEEIDYSAYFKNAPAQVKGILQERMQQEFDRLKDKTFFTFSSDKALKLEVPNYLEKKTFIEGKWRMNSSEDSLFLKLSELEQFKIEILSSEILELSTEDPPKRTVRLSRMN